MSTEDFNGKPIGYKIIYHQVSPDSNFNPVIVNYTFVTVNYTRNFTELANLTAFTEYIINVSAVSSGGEGPGNSTTARTDDAGKIA